MDLTELYQVLRSLWVVWLMALFLGIAVWAYWPSRRREMDECGRIPLNDGPASDQNQER